MKLLVPSFFFETKSKYYYAKAKVHKSAELKRVIWMSANNWYT